MSETRETELYKIIDGFNLKTDFKPIKDCINDIAIAMHQDNDLGIVEEIGLKKAIMRKTGLKSKEYSVVFEAKRFEIKGKDIEEKERTDEIKSNEDAKEQRKIRKLAEDILEKGNPVDFIKKTAHQFHIGDDKLLVELICSVACQSVINSEGLQPKLSGSSGKGKSHCCKIICHLMPPSHFIETSLSTKALFYMDELQAGTTIFCDDFVPNEDLVGVIKRATSNYQTETIHTTVVKSKGTRMTIPARINWWLTSVSDEQGIELLNRQFQVDVDESEELDDEVHIKQRKELKTGKIHLMVNDDVLTCREIFAIIKEQPEMRVKGEDDFVDKIKFDNTSNRRDFPTFCDFMKAFTVLNFRQRDSDTDGVLIINKKDLDEAEKLYGSRAIHQKLKLNNSDLNILKTIEEFGLYNQEDSGSYEISAPQLQKKLGVSQTNLFYKMNGRPNHPDGGLLNKYPGVQSKKRIVNRTPTRYYILTRSDYKIGDEHDNEFPFEDEPDRL